MEYVISELVRCLHGFGTKPNGAPEEPWDRVPREIPGLKVGVVGIGASGGRVADALHFLGAEITYFSRREKPDAKAKVYRYLALKTLLEEFAMVNGYTGAC